MSPWLAAYVAGVFVFIGSNYMEDDEFWQRPLSDALVGLGAALLWFFMLPIAMVMKTIDGKR